MIPQIPLLEPSQIRGTSSRSSHGVMLFFGLFWCAVTGAVGVGILWGALRALPSYKYPSTDGVVLDSREIGSRHTPQLNRKLDLSFRYRVNGREYVGTRAAFGDDIAHDSNSAEARRNWQPGARVRVYYNPANPADSALRRGLSPMALAMMLFLTPFVCIGGAILGGAMYGLGWRFLPGKRVAGRRVHTLGNLIYIHATGFEPWQMFLAGVGLSSFLATFVVLIPDRLRESEWAALSAWGVVLCTGMLSGFRTWRGNAGGRRCLGIQPAIGMLLLPALDGGREPRTIECRRVQALEIEEIAETDSEGSATHSYTVHLHVKPAQGEPGKIPAVKGYSIDEARQVALWLQTMLSTLQRS